MIKRTYLLIPVLGLIYGCSKTTITMSHVKNCLNENRCEEIAIDKAIKNGIVQEQLLDALGTDTRKKRFPTLQSMHCCLTETGE